MTVQAQLLQADGKQLTVGPAAVISGTLGATTDLKTAPAVQTLIQTQLNKGLHLVSLTLTGTGQYQDFLAGNGKAQQLTNSNLVFGPQSQQVTILFYRDVAPWNVDIRYLSVAPQNQQTVIRDAQNQPISARFQQLAAPTQSLITYVKDLPDYLYQMAVTSPDRNGDLWQQVADLHQVPFQGFNQGIIMIYNPANRATVTIKDVATGKILKSLDYTQDPSLRGKWGTTSQFSSKPYLELLQQQHYHVVQDPTQQIVFASSQAPMKNYEILVAPNVTAQREVKHEDIFYVDTQGLPVAAPNTQTMTFLTVTNQVTQEVSHYQHADTASLPPLTAAGQPTVAGWQLVAPNQKFQFPEVQNPQVAGQRVVAMTIATGDLTRVPAVGMTQDSNDVLVRVSYAPIPQPTPKPTPTPQPVPTPKPTPTPAPQPVQPQGPITQSQSDLTTTTPAPHPQATANQPTASTTTPTPTPLIVGGHQNSNIVATPPTATGSKPQSMPDRRNLTAVTSRQRQQVQFQAQLPQTAERSTNFFQWLGLALLTSCLGAMGFLRRHH